MLTESEFKLRYASTPVLRAKYQGFRRNVEQHSPRTFGLFSCSKATNEVNYLAQKFARQVIGSNNVDSCNRT